MRHKFFWPLFPLILLLMQGCYLIEQGKGQLDLRWNQVPIQEAVLAESNPEYQKLLSLIPEVKAFAEQDLRLLSSENYSGYYATDKKGITFVVTASPKNRLEPYTWWFPIIGSVPYKGFFQQENALKLKESLEQEGYDTWLFSAVAYSTLGWFKDPVTTPMLRRGTFPLVETVIHEMTHVTLYVKDQGDFNEQLASFVGQQGAKLFFHNSQKLSAHQLQQVQENKQRNRQLSKLIYHSIPKLEKLYGQALPIRETLQQREALFSELIDEIVLLFPGISRSHWQFNNARLLQYRRYKEESPLFKQLWAKSEENWPKFWQLVDDYVVQQGWKS